MTDMALRYRKKRDLLLARIDLIRPKRASRETPIIESRIVVGGTEVASYEKRHSGTFCGEEETIIRWEGSAFEVYEILLTFRLLHHHV